MIMSIATELTRIQQAKADIKTSIESKGVTVPSATTIDGYPSLVNTIQTFDPYAGHDYVEIGGLKWATMNIGANSVTDYGQYFQWGDTTGYLSSDAGIQSKANKKPFNWSDYKFSGGRTSPGNSGQTKYNISDGKTVLDKCDDAARANWGGSWRMPTTAEFQALGNAVNTAWTASYQGSSVSGLVCTDKTDSSKVLFFPAAGRCYYGSVDEVGSYCNYWSSSLESSSKQFALSANVGDGYVNWRGSSNRLFGFPVRGVVG